MYHLSGLLLRPERKRSHLQRIPESIPALVPLALALRGSEKSWIFCRDETWSSSQWEKSEFGLFLTLSHSSLETLGLMATSWAGWVLGGCWQEVAEGRGLAQPGSHHMERGS